MGDKNTIASGLYAFVTLVKMACESPLFSASLASAKMLGPSLLRLFICFPHSQAPPRGVHRNPDSLLPYDAEQFSSLCLSGVQKVRVGGCERDREMWGYGMWGLSLTQSNLSKLSSPNKKQYLTESNLANSQVAAAAAAKSLQSCPTLCDPRDGSPPGSPISGILQARTLEWVAISFSNA